MFVMIKVRMLEKKDPDLDTDNTVRIRIVRVNSLRIMFELLVLFPTLIISFINFEKIYNPFQRRILKGFSVHNCIIKA
jgi:hypothetical protein